MKKILFVHGSADLYGAGKILLSTLNSLDKKNIEAVVAMPYKDVLDKEIESSGFKVVVFPIAVLRRQNFSPKGILMFAADLLRSIFFIHRLDTIYNFDAVYTSTSAVISGAFYARLFGKKHIWHVLEITLKPKVLNYLIPRIINLFSDICICISNAVKSYVRSGGMKESRITVIYSGTPLSAASYKAGARVDPTNIVVGMVGRFNRMKGQETLVRAASGIIKEGHSIIFLIVGSVFKNETVYIERMKSLISELHLQGKVEISDFEKEIASIYRRMDIVVIPSTQPEGLGLVAVEAMAMKKPVICSNLGGLSEIVVDGETGIIFKSGDDEQLKDAILKLAGDASLRERMGEAGFRRQQFYFTEDRYMKQINKAIAEFLNRKS